MAVSGPSIDKDDIGGGGSTDETIVTDTSQYIFFEDKIPEVDSRFVDSGDDTDIPSLIQILQSWGFKGLGKYSNLGAWAITDKHGEGLSLEWIGELFIEPKNSYTHAIKFKNYDHSDYQFCNDVSSDGSVYLNNDAKELGDHRYSVYISEIGFAMRKSSTYLWNNKEDVLKTLLYFVTTSDTKSYIYHNYLNEECYQKLTLNNYKINQSNIQVYSFEDNKLIKHHNNKPENNPNKPNHYGNFTGEGPVWNGTAYNENSYFGATPFGKEIPLWTNEDKKSNEIIDVLVQINGLKVSINNKEWEFPEGTQIIFAKRQPTEVSLDSGITVKRTNSSSMDFWSWAKDPLIYRNATPGTMDRSTGANLEYATINTGIGYDTSWIYLSLNRQAIQWDYRSHKNYPEERKIYGALVSSIHANSDVFTYSITLNSTTPYKVFSFSNTSDTMTDYWTRLTSLTQDGWRFLSPAVDFVHFIENNSFEQKSGHARSTVFNNVTTKTSGIYGVALNDTSGNTAYWNGLFQGTRNILAAFSHIPRPSIFKLPYPINEYDTILGASQLLVSGGPSSTSVYTFLNNNSTREQTSYMNVEWTLDPYYVGIFSKFNFNLLVDKDDNPVGGDTLFKDFKKADGTIYTLPYDFTANQDEAPVYIRARWINDNDTTNAYWIAAIIPNERN